ncbi:MAG: phospholipid carrier-dependent glycosyltransferase [Bacteroidota bacterium]|nr:phospholipid carrier-dependent glycosyltransferase [Bacteroidota bacterium]MDX5427226.1 phospholipid carrier-dependent glycosyltransferase [Bacteroidota bacterium]MDX5505182.1 phospholipid carrier-dependent glycosyltransferase [Bacteroidota bacterium]
MKSKQTSSSSETSFFWKYGYLFVILAVFLGVYQYTFNENLNTGGDNAGYYILGKSIKEGLGYSDIHFPDMPPANHFPPGYPMILALFMVFSETITFLKVVNGLFLLGSSLVFFQIFRRLTESRPMAFAGSILMLLNVHLLSYSSIMMSEIPFLFFSALALLWFIRTEKRTDFYRDPNFYLFLLATVFSYHIRTAGIALVGGFGLYLLIRRRWSYLVAFVGGFFALCLPWFLRGQSLGGNAYVEQLFMVNPYRPDEGKMAAMDWLTRLWENLSRYITYEIPYGIFPGLQPNYREDPTAFDWFVGIMIVGIILFGILRLKNYRILMVGYMLGSFAILMLWPDVWFGTRFILPLIPFLLFFFVYALQQIAQEGLDRAGIKATFNPMLLLLFGFIFIKNIKDLHESSKQHLDPKYANFFAIGDWISKNAPEDAVVANRKPTLLYLYSGRTSVRYPYSYNPQEVFDFFVKNGVTHVVVDQLGYSSTGLYLAPAINSNMEKFRNLYTLPNPDTYLLAFDNTMGYNGEYKVIEPTKEDEATTAVREGHGTYRWPDGRVYEGEWLNGQKSGQGTLKFPDGRIFEGLWQNDLQNGPGVLKNSDGTIIQEGVWKDGQFQGDQTSSNGN